MVTYITYNILKNLILFFHFCSVPVAAKTKFYFVKISKIINMEKEATKALKKEFWNFPEWPYIMPYKASLSGKGVGLLGVSI